MDITLNGTWDFQVDENDCGIKEQWYSIPWIKANTENKEKIQVPSNFNSLPGLLRYTGVVWYFRKLPDFQVKHQNEYNIEFEGVNYIATVWLNGENLGTHEGGFLPFRFEFDPHILLGKKENWLVVRVDSKLNPDGVPRNNVDWFNWSGIYRNTQIVILQRVRIRHIKVVSEFTGSNPKQATLHVRYMVKNVNEYMEQCLSKGIEPRADYELFYLGRFLKGEQQINKVLIQTGSQSIGEGNYKEEDIGHITHDQKGLEDFFSGIKTEEENKTGQDMESFFNSDTPPEEKTEPIQKTHIVNKKIETPAKSTSLSRIFDNLKIVVHNPALWSHDNPELYELRIILKGTDEEKRVKIGIRNIRVLGQNILLNNIPIQLKGICLHEELDPKGRTYSLEQRRLDILHMKNYGFNALRTAHYPHDEAFIQAADEEGILILEEIPVYWNVQFDNPKVFKLAGRMIHDLIHRDYNHPSVIQWSVGNEIPVENLACHNVILKLIELAKKMDSTRIVTYVSSRMFCDNVRKNVTVNCINTYFGWYYLSVFQLNFFLDAMSYSHPNTPWIMTEFGADAKRGYTNSLEKYSEEYQARLLQHSIKVLNSKPYIAGWFIWIYRDFRSPLRQNQFQMGFNRKGIVDEKNQPKLSAKIMRKIINLKLKPIRHFKFLAHLFYFLARYVEKFIMGIAMNIGYIIQEKMIQKYYRTQRELEAPNLKKN